ncbi:MAG: hypothetical protein E7073_05105 [Bacteroidales bacterium]|nr:hypothetical protein [Bacteroidales bacterium]
MDEIFKILPDWLTAIGTLGAVLVALFWSPIRKWWNRPEINMSIVNEEPYVEIVSMDSINSSSVDKNMVIRVCITNKGKYTADYAALNVDEYLKKRDADSGYVRKVFTPKQFKDCNNAKLSVIAPHLKYYVDIASVQKFQGMASANEKGESKQFYKLFLLGDGKSLQLGKGDFIIPLKFYSSRSGVSVAYLKILWDNDDFVINKDCFDVRMISEQEYKKISKI